MHCDRTCNSAWPRVLEVGRQTVDLCAFGHYYRKGTDLWTSLTSWQPQGLTGDGRCHQCCGQGSIDPITGSFRHFFALSVEPWRAKQGKGSGAMRYAMPPQLLQEVSRVAQTDAPSYQDVVIDICAGDRNSTPTCTTSGPSLCGS